MCRVRLKRVELRTGCCFEGVDWSLRESETALTELSKIKRLKRIFQGKLVVEEDTNIGYLLLPRISGQNRIYRGPS